MTTESNKTDVLEELVGAGKKFATVEDLAKGKKEADAFVETLKRETNELREALGKALAESDKTSALEKLMTKLNEKDNGTTKDPSGKEPTHEVANHATSLTQDDIVKILEQREAQAVAQRNLATTRAAWTKVFGDKAEDQLKAKALELGLSVEQLESLAKTSPNAFYNLVGLTQKDIASRNTASMGSANSAAVTSQTTSSDTRNKAYYDNLKKEMGASKFIMDKNIQIQLHRDLIRLGDSWDAS